MPAVQQIKKQLKVTSGIPVNGYYYRFVSVAYVRDLLSCAGSWKAGGRYNRRETFQVLYMAADAPTAMKEARLVEKFRLPPKILITIEVVLAAVLDLGEVRVVEGLGMDPQELRANWRYPSAKESSSQRLGRLVYEAEVFEGIRYPSARARGKYNLAVFPDRLRKSSSLRIYDPDKMISNIMRG